MSQGCVPVASCTPRKCFGKTQAAANGPSANAGLLWLLQQRPETAELAHQVSGAWSASIISWRRHTQHPLEREHIYTLWRRARSVVYMIPKDKKDRNCTFADALHECKGAYCADQVLQVMV